VLRYVTSLTHVKLWLNNCVVYCVVKLNQTIMYSIIKKTKVESGKQFARQKTVEECCELATALMQDMNKQVDHTDEIEEEIADVLVWVEHLSQYYNLAKIQQRVQKKRKRYRI